MSLEAASFIKGLVSSNPPGSDPKSQMDDHLRLIKGVLQSQFAGFTDGIPITKTESQLNAMLLAGAFGLGGYGIPFVDANLPANVQQTGFYYYQGGGSNVPPGAAAGDTLLHQAVNADFMTQTWIRVTDAQKFTRRYQTGQGWLAWKPYVQGVKQSGPLDSTAAALLIVGAFGLGDSGTNYPPVNIDGAPALTQFIGIVPGTTGSGPPGSVQGDMILQVSFNASGMFQLYFGRGGLQWVRTFTGIWSAWVSINPTGVGQTWQVVSRAYSTVYTNGTGRPIQVSIAGTTGGTSGSVALTVAGVVVAQPNWASIGTGNLPWSISAIIPAAAAYSLTGGGTLNSWTELR